MSAPAISFRIPFADLLGVDIVSATKEQIEARMLVRPDVPTAFLRSGESIGVFA